MLTVAFATYNGADTLPTMLDALTRLREPAGGWRLIAVNNASTDSTGEILAGFMDRLPMTILEQPAAGKSRALNMALGQVEGDLLVLTDDDVVPDENWLVVWREYANRHPEFGVFGGLIRPLWLQEPPDWLLSSIPLGIAYAATHKGLEAGATDPLYIAGPNMAVRTAAFAAGLRFNEDMGPCAGTYHMGEDTAFAYAAETLGFPAAHCPAARVRHIVQPEQYELAWLRYRAYRYGQINGAQAAAAGTQQQSAQLLGVPRWVVREYFGQQLRLLTSRLRSDAGGVAAAAWYGRYWQGFMQGYRHQNCVPDADD